MQFSDDISPKSIEVFEAFYIEPMKKQIENDWINIIKFLIGVDQMMCPLDDRRVFE